MINCPKLVFSGAALLVLPLLAAGPRDAPAAPLKHLEINCSKGEAPLAAGLRKARKAGGGVLVVAGTCRENIQIDFDGLTLQGDKAGAVLVGVKEGAPTVLIDGGRAIIENVEVKDGLGSGIAISRGAALKLVNATVAGNKGNGIEALNSATAELKGCTVSGNGLSALKVSDGAFAALEANTLQGGLGAPGVLPAVYVTNGAKVTSRGDTITGTGAPAVVVDGAGQFNTEPVAGSDGAVTNLTRNTASVTDGTSNTLVITESSTADLNRVNVSGTTEIRDGSSSTIGFSETPEGTDSAHLGEVNVGWRSYVQMDNVSCDGSVRFAAQDAVSDGTSNTINFSDGSTRTIVEDSQVRSTNDAAQGGCRPGGQSVQPIP
jgi:hypothetical protein